MCHTHTHTPMNIPSRQGLPCPQESSTHSHTHTHTHAHTQVFVFKRTGGDIAWNQGRDVWMDELALAQRPYCPPGNCTHAHMFGRVFVWSCVCEVHIIMISTHAHTLTMTYTDAHKRTQTHRDHGRRGPFVHPLHQWFHWHTQHTHAYTHT